MSQFEFFMAFYGLLLGLGVAELLNGFVRLLREKTPPRLGLLTPLVGLLLLTEMMLNFVEAWASLQDVQITLTSLIHPAMIGICYYVAAASLVPTHHSEWESLDDYFLYRRKWIIGTLLLVNVLITGSGLPEVIPHVVAKGLQGIIGFPLMLLWYGGSYVVLMFARKRRVIAAAAISLLLYYAAYYGPLRIWQYVVA